MIKTFKVHPHKGYLNTDFCFYTENENVRLVDELDGRVISLHQGSYISIKLAAGTHLFRIDGNEQCQKVSVEDAWRFGGSKVKYTYCSDISPWIVCVMKDRMYLYNSETKEEYVENGISPDTICDIAKDYLLFQSDNGKINSIYDCRKRKEIEKFTDLLYNKNSTLIFSRPTDGVLEFGHYHFFENGNKIRSINKGTDYSIYANDIYIMGINKEFIVAPIDAPMSMKFTPIQGDTLCLIKNSSCAIICCYHYYGRTDISVFDIKNKSRYSYENIYDFIESINGHIVKEINEDCQQCFKVAKKLTDTYPNLLHVKKEYINLEFFAWNEKVFCLQKSIIQESTNNKNVSTSYVTRIVDVIDKKILYTNNRNLSVSALYILKNTLLIPDITLRNYVAVDYNTFNITEMRNIEVHSYKDSFIYVSHLGYDSIVSDADGRTIVRTKSELDFSLLPYNVIEDKTNHNLIHFSGNNSISYVQWTSISYTTTKILICSTRQAGTMLLSASVNHPAACPLDINTKCCNISKSGSRIIGFKNGIPMVYTLSNGSYECTDTPWKGLFDDSSYSNAWFDITGNCFMYDENDRIYNYYNCITGITETFEAPQLVVDNKNFGVNSYKPLMDINSYRLPIFRNPYNLQPISGANTSCLSFVSPDGRYVADSDYSTKYYNKITGLEISKKEYSKLSKTLNSHEKPNEELIIRRRSFVEENKEYFKDNDKIEDNIKTNDHFTSLFVEISYYLILHDTQNDSVIELKLFSAISFLNYVSFSFSSKYVAIAGLNKTNGFVEVFDIESGKSVFKRNPTRAVWLASFNKNGHFAYYTSTPDTNIVSMEELITRKCSDGKFSNGSRSFLTFSPSGKYFVLSKQGYTPYLPNSKDWGHQPSCDIYIHSVDNTDECLKHFNDHGDAICGVAIMKKSVAAVAFSIDEKKLLSVSNDGVVIVRNLHLL